MTKRLFWVKKDEEHRGARSASLRAALQPLPRLPPAVLGLLRSVPTEMRKDGYRSMPGRPLLAAFRCRCTLLIRSRPATTDA